MKFLALALLCISAQSFACSCDKYALGIQTSVIEHVKSKLDIVLNEEDVIINQYYPTSLEKRTMNKEPWNSCLTKIAGEPFHMCARKRKADVQIDLPEIGCTVEYKVTTNTKKAKVKEISSSCN